MLVFTSSLLTAASKPDVSNSLKTYRLYGIETVKDFLLSCLVAIPHLTRCIGKDRLAHHEAETGARIQLFAMGGRSHILWIGEDTEVSRNVSEDH
jgi:hypothetical protein